tara:strand:+ start:1051 stop:1425 length:375 start_codon:yes stop_codon:yes gene_type:complete
MSLYAQWLSAKADEKQAVEKRREIEDLLLEEFAPNPFEGVKSISDSGYNLKLTGRMVRKIDSEKLQELAEESGLSEHLGSLFRWVPSINMAAWKATDKSITNSLLEAITTKEGRPSFSIIKEEV